MKSYFSHNKFLGAGDDFNNSSIVLIGLPFDNTSSYLPGSRFAPQQIRSASWNLETFSPYQNRDLNTVNFFDLGDFNVPAECTTENVLTAIKENAQNFLAQKKKVLAMGGEHLVCLPLIEAYYKCYPNLQLIQFDAHADLRDVYTGGKYSHATVMRRVVELLGWENVYQLGIRSGEEEEFALGRAAPHFHPFNLQAMDKYLAEINGRPIYLTLDLDVLDPSILPGTGTPEPGGIDFLTLLNVLLKFKGTNLVGGDVTELNPQNDPTVCSSAVAAKILRELLFLLSNS